MSESPASTSFCETFFQESSDLIVASDTTTDQRFRNYPLVRGEPFIRFYAAARLTVGDQTVGTLCVCDTTPHQVTASQLEDLRALANAAMHVLTARFGGRVNRPVLIGDSVVLLDDNAASARALSELITLSAPELSVASCTDWTSALPATLAGSPRAVIVDIKGSNAPSLASVHAIRSVVADAAPSFIAVSADVLDLDALRCPGGFDHAFAKPLEFDALLAALKR